jgi:hypothetical protein
MSRGGGRLPARLQGLNGACVRGLAVVLFAASLPVLLSAQGPVPGGRGGATETLTRSAGKYQDLEMQLIRALEDKSQDALDRILAEDFEVWSAERTEPTSRQDWTRAGFTARVRSSRVRQITVREFGDTAVVSFLLERQLTAAGVTSTLFVVDVWNAAANRLSVRYVSVPRRPAPAQKRKI